MGTRQRCMQLCSSARHHHTFSGGTCWGCAMSWMASWVITSCGWGVRVQEVLGLGMERRLADQVQPPRTTRNAFSACFRRTGQHSDRLTRALQPAPTFRPVPQTPHLERLLRQTAGALDASKRHWLNSNRLARALTWNAFSGRPWSSSPGSTKRTLASPRRAAASRATLRGRGDCSVLRGVLGGLDQRWLPQAGQ